MKNLYSNSEKVFIYINYILLFILAISTIYPIIYIFAGSISSGAAVDRGDVILFPKEITFYAYKHVIKDKLFWTSYRNTFYYVIVGTIYSMIISITGAYALSRKRLKGRRFFNLLVVFTMWFNAGMIPTYLNIKALGLDNSMIGIVVSFGIQAFNIILLRNYFESIPVDLEEAANMDGAGEFTLLFKIFIPISKPAITTVWLFYAISRWNGYFWSMILINDPNKIPLQNYLKMLIIDMENAGIDGPILSSDPSSLQTRIFAVIICSLIPVIIIYPFIQKYFTKGIMVGGIKE